MQQIGENSFIFENNVIQPFVRVGNNCILWSGNHVGHRTVLRDHVFVMAPAGAMLGASIGMVTAHSPARIVR